MANDKKDYSDLTKESIAKLHQRHRDGHTVTKADFTALCHMAHKYLELQLALEIAAIAELVYDPDKDTTHTNMVGEGFTG